MFLIASLLTLLLALSITGSPVEVRNSPIITRRLNFSSSTIDLVQHDKARVAAFRDYNTHDQDAKIIPITFAPSGQYIVELGVGSPPMAYKLIVDTGSAVTWIGAHTPYDGTGVNTGHRVEETYGGGHSPVSSFSGTFFLDTVTLGLGLTIPNYELAVASTSTRSFEDFDGILGLGPRYLTVETLPDDADATYPTFTDWLVTADAIGRNVVGIFFQPLTWDRDTYVGELAFGEPDYTKCTDDIVYADITNTFPSTDYWGIDLMITYGDTDILEFSAGFIDTGCEFILIASDAYASYQAATGATFDQPTGLLRITADQYDALQDLKFHIGNQILSLVPNAQIWPRSLNYRLRGGEDDGIYLIIKSLNRATGAGLDFIAGYTFIQRFYTVLDRDNHAVGFATTPFTYATTNYII